MKKNILLVTNETTALKNELLLKVKDYDVHVQSFINDPWENFELIDIVLVDVDSLKKEEARKVLKKINEKCSKSNKPFVIYTTSNNAQSGQMTEYLALGVRDILDKNSPLPVLKMKFDKIIESEEYRQQITRLKHQLNGKTKETELSGYPELFSLVNDSRDWDFIQRVISQEGPIHKRVVNTCFLRVLNLIIAKWKNDLDKEIQPYPFDTLKPDTLPGDYIGGLRGGHPPHHHPRNHPRNHPGHHPGHHPHHHPHHHEINSNIPIGVPSRLLNLIYGNDSVTLSNTVASLFDGPPHDVYMNVLMLHVFEQFFTLLEETGNETYKC